MAKALETLLIVGVVAVGGYVAIRMLQGRPFLSNIGGGWNPFQFTRQPYIASPTTPGALQPKTANVPTPASRAQSSGGGVGGPGYVVPGTPKSSSSGGLTCATLPKTHPCYPFRNSPGTCQGCLNAQSGFARRRKTLVGQMRDFPRWSYNAVSHRINVI